jgi:hypothetical protein
MAALCLLPLACFVLLLLFFPAAQDRTQFVLAPHAISRR